MYKCDHVPDLNEENKNVFIRKWIKSLSYLRSILELISSFHAKCWIVLHGDVLSILVTIHHSIDVGATSVESVWCHLISLLVKIGVVMVQAWVPCFPDHHKAPVLGENPSNNDEWGQELEDSTNELSLIASWAWETGWYGGAPPWKKNVDERTYHSCWFVN